MYTMYNMTFNSFLYIYLYPILIFIITKPVLLSLNIRRKKISTFKSKTKASKQEQKEFKYKYLLITNSIKGKRILSFSMYLSAMLSFFFISCNFGAYAEGGYNASLVKMTDTTIGSFNAFFALLFLSLFMFFNILEGELRKRFFSDNKDGIDFYYANEKYCSPLFLTNRSYKIDRFIKITILIFIVVFTFLAYTTVYLY